MQVRLKEKQMFSQIPQPHKRSTRKTHLEDPRQKKKRNIAASTSVYMEMVNNQLLTIIY
jgi:hypothetical protein